MPLGLSKRMPIKLAMSVAFSGSADAWVLMPWKNAMQMGCAHVQSGSAQRSAAKPVLT